MTEAKNLLMNIGPSAISRSRRLQFLEKHMLFPPVAHLQTIEKRGSNRKASEVGLCSGGFD